MLLLPGAFSYYLDWFAAHHWGWTPDQRRSLSPHKYRIMRAIERAFQRATREQEDAQLDDLRAQF